MFSFIDKIKDKIDIEETKNLRKAELFAEKKRRVLLVIRVRWATIGFYLLFGLFSFALIYNKYPANFSFRRMGFYVLGIMTIAAYNYFLYTIHNQICKQKLLAQLLMIIDVIAVTFIVYFTGGNISWFWSTYLLVIMQSAFLFDEKTDTFKISIFASFCYLVLIILLRSGLPINNYIAIIDNTKGSIFNILKSIWVISSNIAIALIAGYLLNVIRQREYYLAYQSITDSLTGLYNHNYFYKRLKGEIDRSKRYNRNFSLIVMDIDGFKQFNDTQGHQVGDRLLSDVANIFHENLRADDVDTAYRYGGDEFAIIAPETGCKDNGTKMADAISFAERIRSKIEHKLGINVSIGVCCYPHHGKSTEELFKAADVALYKAKASGKNCIVLAEEDGCAIIPDKKKTAS